MKARKAPLASGIESAKKSEELAKHLRDRIVAMAREAGRIGLTISEAEREIEDHKGHSVSPRFAELLKRGALVRVLIGRGQPTKRFPYGSLRCVTRFDESTRRNVTVHWVPEFAPAPPEKRNDPDQNMLRGPDCAATSSGSKNREGLHV